LISGFVAETTAEVSAAQPEMAMRCSLDLYSGRSNPSWDLTPSETAELLARLRALPPTGKETLFDGLGYRGIIVTADRDGATEIETVVASNGIVLVRQRDGSESWYRDPGREFERWLLRTSKNRIQASDYEIASQALER
jgi:hypothetical protein